MTSYKMEFSKMYTEALDRSRPYDGQPHTDGGGGERGRQLVSGVTMRDIFDSFIVACYRSSGLDLQQYPDSVYRLPWNKMDPWAIGQNLTCEIEKRMGIYPNVPTLEKTTKYWCYTESDQFLPAKIVKSEDEILAEYFNEWSQKMFAAGKEHLISKEQCIQDWVTVNWAFLCDKNGKYIPVKDRIK